MKLPEHENRAPALKFRGTRSSIHFVCSSVEEGNGQNIDINEGEAKSVADVLV